MQRGGEWGGKANRRLKKKQTNAKLLNNLSAPRILTFLLKGRNHLKVLRIFLHTASSLIATTL